MKRVSRLQHLFRLPVVVLTVLAVVALARAQQPVSVPWSEAVKPGGRLSVDWVKGAGVNLGLQAQVTNNAAEPRLLTAPVGLTFTAPVPSTQIMLLPRNASWESPPHSSVTIVLPVVALNADRYAPTEFNFTWSYGALPQDSPVRGVLVALAEVERSVLPRAAVGVAVQSQTEVAVSLGLPPAEFVAAVASEWKMDSAGAVSGRLSNTVVEYAVWSATNGLTQARLAEHVDRRYPDWPVEERQRLQWQIAGGVGLLLLRSGVDPRERGWPLPEQAEAALSQIRGEPGAGLWPWAGPLFLGPGPKVSAFSPAPAPQWNPRLMLTNRMSSELTVWLKGPTLHTLKIAPGATFTCEVLPGIYRYGAKIPEAPVVTGLLVFEPHRDYSWDYTVELPGVLGPTTAQITVINLTGDPLRLTVGPVTVVVPAQGRRQIELAPGTYAYEGSAGSIQYRGERTFKAGPGEWTFSPPQ